ncbi:hypothetical protein LP52_03415 [Streptomonospora alba]|uniref:Uncharacterized protein n=1 Tax=Streptomonospora alba TaxID=183763 RepID=A0A0C2FL23_9ACTN|nr:hypothetical protein [Streptomonospora alba]KII00010.1 hypothetical protein LP52_03415 [Streptomonospora alba]
MSPKKRSNKGKRGGAQVSGNPQKRAEQAAEREARPPVFDGGDEPAPPMPDWGLGVDWASGSADAPPTLGQAPVEPPHPGWAESHHRVLERAHEAEIPGSPLALDTLTCELVGRAYVEGLKEADREFDLLIESEEAKEIDESELFERAEQLSGYDSDPVGWLDLLAESAAREITDAAKTPRWESPWMLLRGMMAWVPYVPDSESGSPLEAASMALMEAGQRLLDDGALPRLPDPLQDLRPQPTAWPLVLHDAYGSRAALMAPFAYGDERHDPHWYCWDIDRCAGELVLSAGVFGSAEEAAAQWRTAVGDSAPADAAPQRCSGQEAADLLEIAMDTHLLAGMRIGNEDDGLVVEQFRSAARAEEVSISFEDRLPLPQAGPESESHHGAEDFRAWYTDRHGTAPEAGAVTTLAEVWGPEGGPVSLRYACSPHRIRSAAMVLGDSDDPAEAQRVLGLLPDWVEWCLDHSGLTGEAAEAARTLARRIADEAGRDAFDPQALFDLPFRPKEL